VGHLDESWFHYERWNDALVEYFFSSRVAAQPAYLDAEEDAVVLAGRTAGIEAEDFPASFREAVRNTLVWEGQQAFMRHTDALRRWVDQGRVDAPPFVGLLSAFAMAAEQMHGDESLAEHNYYGRLCEVLGIASGDTKRTEKLRRDYGKYAATFWDELNRWLLSEGGRRGLPTAAAFDRRVHVGIPISQALVRTADREDLQGMFSAYRLRPHQRIARQDMVELLEAWTPAAPAGLRRLLTGGATLLGHVADVALVELANWDGRQHRRTESGGQPASHDGALLFAATYRRSPWRRLDLRLVAFGALTGTWSPPGDAGGPAAEAARHANGLRAVDDVDGWTRFEGEQEASVPDMLKGLLVLEGPEGRVERQARRLVVFEADDAAPWLVERPRVQLWEDTWLLAHETVTGRLESLLEDFARPGFVRLGPADLRGLPEGWVFYHGVQLAASPGDLATGSEDLLPLVPLSDSHVTVAGPRHLVGHGLFHQSSPLEVRATASGEAGATLSLLREFQFDDAAGAGGEEQELSTVDEARVLQLDDLALGDGDYRLLLRRKGRLLTSATFRLRSAAHPLGPSPWLSGWVGHVPGQGRAVAAAAEPDSSWLRGAEVVGDVDLPSSDFGMPPSVLGEVLGVRDDESGPEPSRRALSSTDMPCPPHRIELPPTDNEGQMPRRFKGHCRICGLERWYRRGGGRHRGRPTRRTTAAARWAAEVELPTLPPARGAEYGDPDFLLDALTTVGSGSWQTFERLVDVVAGEPWAAAEHARTLAALGHLEVYASPGKSPRWAVTPPALVRAASEVPRAFLAGARSPRLSADLKTVAAELECVVTVTRQADAPSLVMLEASTEDDLALIADEVGLTYSSGAAGRVLAFVPRLSQLAFEHALLAPPYSPSTSRYDPTTGRWETVPTVQGDGTYQLGLRPVRYLLVHRGRPFEVDNQVGKYTAAAAAGVAAMAYDTVTRTLTVPIGARLPGLAERAAVLCSGRAPVEVNGGRLAYVEVTPEVARGVWGSVGIPGMRED